MNKNLKLIIKTSAIITVTFTIYKLTTTVIIPASGLSALLKFPVRILDIQIPKWFIVSLIALPCTDPAIKVYKSLKSNRFKNNEISTLISNFSEDKND